MRGARNVTAQVLGGEPTVLEGVETVGDALSELGLEGNYTATVNGDPADMSQELEDYEFISFSSAVKGGC